MLTKKHRILMFAAVTIGALFVQGVEGGCWNIDTQALMTSIQPCAIFNCTTGLFGGAINLCGQPGNPADDVVTGCP